MDGFNADLVGGVLLTSLCVIAGKIGMVSSTVASSVLRASPTSYKHNQHRLTLHPITKRVRVRDLLPSPWARILQGMQVGSYWTSQSLPSPVQSHSHRPYRWSGRDWLWVVD